MKYVHHFFIVFQLLLGVTLGASAQAPQVIHYQAVIHDGADVLSNTEIGVRTSILQDSAKGSAVYVQTDTITTSSDGLVNIVIGQSNNQTGMLSEVDWSAGPFFLKLETDPEGGDMYTDSATTQFVSVPFGYQSAESASVSIRVSASGDTLYIGSQERVIIPGISAINSCTTCYPAGYQYCNGVVTEIVDVFNPTTGRYWMDRNLGALRQAQSSTDAQGYGDLFQWGRFADGHQCRYPEVSETTLFYANTSAASPTTDWYGKFIIDSDNTNGDWIIPHDANLWAGVDAVNNPCPSGYRLPTEAEWSTERSSWSSNNSSGAFGSPLKLPISGIRNPDLEDVGSLGVYWSSSVNSTFARNLEIATAYANEGEDNRANGYSVRCIKNTPPPAYPSNYVHCLPAGDTTDIVAVISSTTGEIWMDRNLGASQVADSSSDANSYGDLFQWGRFADGHQCRNSETTDKLASTSTASADQAWAGKYIMGSSPDYDWLSTPDTTMWQGVDGVNNPCPTGFRIPTETEWEGEIAKWAESGNKNSTGAYNSPLKLPDSGARDFNSGDPLFVGSGGAYWSSSVSGSNARFLYFYSSNAYLHSNNRARGYAVRCLKD